MKAEYVNPFYQATIQVFKLMLDLDLKRVLEADGADSQVIVQLSVSGDLTGTITYHFPEEMALKMVQIMSGMEFNELDSFVTSALAEIANIISGNAMSNLFERNYRCDISPPQVLTSPPEGLNTVPALRLPLETKWGTLIINIALRETPS